MWLRHCERTPVLKKIVSSTVPFVSGRELDTRDQQTEEAITEGNALEATGHRLKPCGYYGLHRKGPIDLEKYKLD